ncbi:MAG: glycosyltransferase family 2 protein [Candidatus Aminicenantes bacterium]|nr:glycosyltransferase family 2 protein [Candidatus Aminicenantes bacterium]
MKHPVVSVIIPTYNREAFICRAIDSVRTQTFNDWELIIVDDASSDKTESVINNYDDNRIISIKHNKNFGPAIARNTALKRAKGRYIAFLDSDDFWCSRNKLKTQIGILMNSSNRVGCVYSQTCQFKNEKKLYFPKENIKKKEGFLYKSLSRCQYFIHLSSVVIKKEVLDRVGYFDENIPATAELDVWLRISKNYSFCYVNQCHVHSFFTPGSISTKRFLRAKAMVLILKKHRKDLSKDIFSLYMFFFNIIRYVLSGILIKLKLKKSD